MKKLSEINEIENTQDSNSQNYENGIVEVNMVPTLGVFGVVEGPDDGMRNDWKKLSDE